MAKEHTITLYESERSTLTLSIKGRSGVVEDFVLEPSIYDVIAYEGALVTASKEKDTSTALRLGAKAAFDHLAVTADGTRMAGRLLRLGASQQKRALDEIEGWYRELSGGKREEAGDRPADPTAGSGESGNGRVSRGKKSKRSRARSSGGSKRASKKKSGRKR